MRSDSKKKCVVNNIPLKKQNANEENIVYCCMSNLLLTA